MVSSQDFCSVFAKVLKDGWGAAPGFDGQVLTKNMIEEKIEDPNVRQAANHWVGKHVVDSGGIFAYAFRTLGMADGYVSDGSYPKKIFDEFCGEKGKLPKGGLQPGTVLFKKRGDRIIGAGLYIGNSSVIEAKSTKAGVVCSPLNSEWTWWGKLKDIAYPELIAKPAVRKKDIREMRVLRGRVTLNGVRSLKVFDSNNAASQVSDTLYTGNEATVLEDLGEFCKVRYSKTGYVKKQFLREVISK